MRTTTMQWNEKRKSILYLAHLPGLQIQEDAESFALATTLYKLPFEDYNRLTFGAFESHASAYVATAPVFLAWYQSADLREAKSHEENIGALQFKISSQKFDPFAMGVSSRRSALAARNLHSIAFAAWATLSLACPTAALIDPQCSVGFIQAQKGGVFRFRPGEVFNIIQVQGETDQEYLFAPALRSDPIEPEDLQRASGLVDIVSFIRKNEELNSALDTLLYSQTPLLGSSDRLTLSVMALESLLVSDKRSQLRKTFARRLSVLSGDGESESMEALARVLYDARSLNLHGKCYDKVASYEDLGYAPQVLAEVLISLGKAMQRGHSLTSIQKALDEKDGMQYGWAEVALDDNPTSCPNDRLNLLARPPVHSVTTTMAAPPEEEILWSPLMGLATTDEIPIGTIRPHIVAPLSSKELGQLEERDIRQDFLQSRRFDEVKRKAPNYRSVLFTPDQLVEDVRTNTSTEEQLTKEASNAVIAMRLAGLHRFSDPVLLGKYFYRGGTRYRQPTVLRQTVLMNYFDEPDKMTLSKSRQISQFLDLKSLLDDKGIYLHWERMISLYRRSFNVRFLGTRTSANLGFAALESILGGFRAQGAYPQLEDYVGVLARGECVDWFRQEARKYRNASAHGRPVEEESLQHLWSVLSQVIEKYLAFLVRDSPQSDRPARVFRTLVAKVFEP